MKKIVILTGASKGLGLATCKKLLVDGYTVIAASRNCSPDLLDIISKNPDVHYEPLDLGNVTALHARAAELVKKYGVPYALINNAALAHDGVLGTMHESQIIEMITVNVTGTIIFTKYISRFMLKSRNGRIVNISSIIASTGFNGLSVYAASKAALNGFTRSLARELGRIGITVNSIAPGYMQTDMSAGLEGEQLDQIRRRSALRRLTTVDEAAGSIAYLLSDTAAAITGTVITVDAGNTA